MNPAHQDLEHRLPVWLALSDLFLDTDVSLSRVWRVETLAASPYSLEELQRILIDEVYPVCHLNLFCVAGEWAGFDPGWLEQKILARLRSPFRRFHTLNLGRLTVPLSREWQIIKKGIQERRSPRLKEDTA